VRLHEYESSGLTPAVLRLDARRRHPRDRTAIQPSKRIVTPGLSGTRSLHDGTVHWIRYVVRDALRSKRHDAISCTCSLPCSVALVRAPPPGAVFRVSFATFAFFLTHALLLLFQACWHVDRFSWIMKVLYWLVLLFVSYLLPEPFYANFYVHVSRVVAGAFLFLQIVILIDFAHALSEGWNKAEDDPKARMYQVLIIVVSLIALITSGVLLVLYYLWFGGSGCELNQFFISFTLCVTLVLIVMSITEKLSDKGGLLPASIVTLYCYWLCYSGLSSDPSSCNSLGGKQETTQLVVGLIVAAASIAYGQSRTHTHRTNEPRWHNELYGHTAS
jgi:hypothetical protein